ncbi:MAG TPA: cupin domain-containing protein [Pseudomonadales bacterium]
MRVGETIYPSQGEAVTCIRSGQDGGPFIFEFELAPGAKGPPTHSHDEGDEVIEVKEGEVVFRINGKDTLLRAGDRTTLTPSERHTFWNPSKTTTLRARVTHTARFERLIAQPSITSLLMYSCFVDPGASRIRNPLVKVAAFAIAWFGRLRGTRMVVDGTEIRPSQS